MYCFVLKQLWFVFIFTQTTYTKYTLDELYSFLVKIEAKGKILVCAGTILTPCSVLTSAYCVEGVDPSEIIITHFREFNVSRYNVSSVVIHPKYNKAVLANDIALLGIEKMFDKPWTVVELNYLPKEEIFLKCNSIQIVGWSGQIMKKSDKVFIKNGIYYEKPMNASMKLISNENCSILIRNFGGVFQGEEKFCGVTNDGEEEGCFTGPGGPLLCSVNEMQNLQVGVVSWGKSCSKVPSVYVRTDFFYDWIVETAKTLTKKCDSVMGNVTLVKPVDNRGVRLNNLLSLDFLMFITVLLRVLLTLFYCPATY